MYFHNIKGVGGGCMHIDETKVNNQTFARYLHEAGYTVGMFGKYLNSNPRVAPLGIDAYMTNGGGTYYSPQFDTTGVADLAPHFMKDGGWQGNATEYTTAVVGNTSLSWIKKVAKVMTQTRHAHAARTFAHSSGKMPMSSCLSDTHRGWFLVVRESPRPRVHL